jgi:hypothetical protein
MRRRPFLATLPLGAVALLAPVTLRTAGVAASARQSNVAAGLPLMPPTLLVWSTVQELLAGDLDHTVTLQQVLAALNDYPPEWPVVGVGTTNQDFRTGELIPDGVAGGLRFWWADPDSASQADVSNLAAAADPPRLPFIALALGDPSRALTWTVDPTDDLHGWLNERLLAAGIALAGVQVRGRFSSVSTTVSYNLPRTGLDLSAGYVGDDYFRFNNYAESAWTMDGVYARPTPLQPVVASGGPLHLHGYQPASMLGGHITSASPVSATATVWPLDQLIDRRGTAGSLASVLDLSGHCSPALS